MAVPFEHCVGSLADTKELEYLSALLQTEFEDVRYDGTLRARDIVVYLRSRHGLDASPKYVEEHLIPVLGGCIHGASDVMDMVQVLGIVLIPFFRQLEEASEDDEEYRNEVLNKAIEAIVSDTWGKSTERDRDETGTRRLDKEVIREILECYGEQHIPESILEEMLEVAGGEGEEFNVQSLLRALTSDVQLYNLEWVDTVSTHFRDAMGAIERKNDFGVSGTNTSLTRKERQDATECPSSDEEKQQEEQPTSNVQRYSFIYTAPSIDYCAETFRSQTFYICIWLSLVTVYAAYFSGDTLNNPYIRIDCEEWAAEEAAAVAESFGCHVLNAIITWLFIFLKLSILGTLFIYLASFGVATSTSVWALVVGMATVVLSTILSYIYAVDTPLFSTEKIYEGQRVYNLALIMGCIVLFLQLAMLLRTIFSERVLPLLHKLTKALTNGMVRKETQTKKAAVFKLKRLIDNSVSLHENHVVEVGGSSKFHASGRALLNYHDLTDVRMRSGGLIWAWKRILDGSLVSEEGLWFHGRLMASNAYQIIVCVLLVFSGSLLLEELHDYDDQGGGEDGIKPLKWQLRLSILVGGIFGLLAAIGIAVVYLPSSVCTTLMFRYGVIPSLGNETFRKYRFAVDLVSQLFGAMFWGCIVTAFITFGIFGGVTFLFAYEPTRNTALLFLATVIGFGFTLLLKVLILTKLRRYFHCGFFRSRPWQSNLLGLMLDCWYVGLSSGYMLMRSIQLILIAVLNIGRIDRPILADGVAHFGPVIMDSYPISFRKDLLQHEAHRHPYIERLGTMYLLKLRHGEGFASRAGSAWRVIFVVALMPWLRKYRFPQLVDVSFDEIDLFESADNGSGSDLSLRGTEAFESARQELSDRHLIVALDSIKEEGQQEEDDDNDSRRGSASMINAVPFLSLAGQKEHIPNSEAEAIAQKRKSLEIERKHRRQSLLAMQQGRSNTIYHNQSNSELLHLQGSLRKNSSRRSQMTRGISLADMTGVGSAGLDRSREAYLELEVESLRNENRLLMRQLNELKATTKEE